MKWKFNSLKWETFKIGGYLYKGRKFMGVSEVSLNLFEQRSKATTKLQNKIQLALFNVKNEKIIYYIFIS